MRKANDECIGKIVGYDERRQVMTVEVPYSDFPTMLRREYKNVRVSMIDSRTLSDKQRRSSYAMLREIADWMGEDLAETKDYMKIRFLTNEMEMTADRMFSLGTAPMSVVAAFQSFLARFIVRYDVPTKKSMLDYVDNIDDYTYACLIHKKCVCCGGIADLHHMDAVGMGRDRDSISHIGLRALPLCREHHTEFHKVGKVDFLKKYHLNEGIEIDKTIAKIYKLKVGKKDA